MPPVPPPPVPALLPRRSMLVGTLVAGGAASTLAGLLAHPAMAADPSARPPHPQPGAFDGSTVRRLAQELARHPYQSPDTRLPKAIDALSFDQYRGIRYQKSRALWQGLNLPFKVEFLPRGFLYRPRIDIFEVVAGKAERVPYDPDLFGYDDPSIRVTEDLGFSGFRIHAPLNRPDYFDELCVFQGASYFRAVAKGQAYGLSARGFANGTGSNRGEEFPLFTAFWLERPQPGSPSVVVHALLDSPGLAGAFRFSIRPGDETVFDVESTLYPRHDLHESGVAPLTGMFYFDANDRSRVDDWRPAAHDSEGLSVWTGHGDQLWRPLVNPRDLQFSAFSSSSPHGFGLMQRKRSFADFQDLALDYEKRPSLWIEPIGDWGQGATDLVEIPSPNEVNDNIVAFWRPKDKLNGEGRLHLHLPHALGLGLPLGHQARLASSHTRIGAIPTITRPAWNSRWISSVMRCEVAGGRTPSHACRRLGASTGKHHAV